MKRRLVISQLELLHLDREYWKWATLPDFYLVRILREANRLGLQRYEIKEVIGLEEQIPTFQRYIDFICEAYNKGGVMEPKNIFDKVNIIRRSSNWIAERIVDWVGRQLGEEWTSRMLEAGGLIAVKLFDSNEIIAVADLPEDAQRIGTTIKIVGVIPGREVFVEFVGQNDPAAHPQTEQN